MTEMQNPYSPPGEQTEFGPEPFQKPRGWRRAAIWLTIILYGALIGMFCVAAVFLTIQASRLKEDGVDREQMIAWSQTLAVECVGMIVVLAVGIFLALRKRLVLSWLAVPCCVLIFFVVALLFGPR